MNYCLLVPRRSDGHKGVANWKQQVGRLTPRSKFNYLLRQDKDLVPLFNGIFDLSPQSSLQPFDLRFIASINLGPGRSRTHRSARHPCPASVSTCSAPAKDLWGLDRWSGHSGLHLPNGAQCQHFRAQPCFKLQPAWPNGRIDVPSEDPGVHLHLPESASS